MCRTKYPEIFAALAAPFEPHEVKHRPGSGGRQLDYVTARTVANRLDSVVGPEHWSDRYYAVCDVLFCEITIRFPDGSLVSKSDAGGFKEMTERRDGATVVDEENTDKTGASDAFKRAAAKWGVARYLYKDGIPDFGHAFAPEIPQPAPEDEDVHSGGKGTLSDWFARRAAAMKIHPNQLVHHLARVAEEEGEDEFGRIASPRAKSARFAELVKGDRGEYWRAWIKDRIDRYRDDLKQKGQKGAKA